MPMAELWCDELHKSLSAISMDCSNRFLKKIIAQTMEHERRYVKLIE
jgi:hypothetical protein